MEGVADVKRDREVDGDKVAYLAREEEPPTESSMTTYINLFNDSPSGFFRRRPTLEELISPPELRVLSHLFRAGSNFISSPAAVWL